MNARPGCRELLEQQDFVVLDGGLATELERRGADLNDPLWSARLLLEAPQLIEDVHYDYFRSGADIATTATYQATIPGFLARGMSEQQARRLIQSGVTIARRARDRFLRDEGDARICLVAGSVGCYGAFLHDGSEYRGDYQLSRQQLVDFHAPRMELLAAAGADLLALETIPRLQEAEILVELVEQSFDLDCWLSCCCRDAQHLSSGEAFGDVVDLANDAKNVVAIGVNCTAPRWLPGLLRTATARSRKPLVVYPNRGEQFEVESGSWSGRTEELDFATAARQWRACGACLIGGCCRTTPDDIRAIRRGLASVE